jgi:hypothetical protein
MKPLPEVCLEGHSLLEDGEFGVQNATNTFAQVPVTKIWR